MTALLGTLLGMSLWLHVMQLAGGFYTHVWDTRALRAAKRQWRRQLVARQVEYMALGYDERTARQRAGEALNDEARDTEREMVKALISRL